MAEKEPKIYTRKNLPRQRKRTFKMQTTVSKLMLEIKDVQTKIKRISDGKTVLRSHINIGYVSLEMLHQAAILYEAQPPIVCMQAAALKRYRNDETYKYRALKGQLLEFALTEMEATNMLMPFGKYVASARKAPKSPKIDDVPKTECRHH